jgi:MoaA/NifB/PqqE/SkfB family radical SAM enzyme
MAPGLEEAPRAIPITEESYLDIDKRVTLSEKIKLLRGLISGKSAWTGPFFVAVRLTQRCNLHCVGCAFHSPYLTLPAREATSMKDFPLALFKKLCGELKLMGTRSLWLTGDGEPLLHPQIFDFIEVAKETGLMVKLITNGVLLDEAKQRSLIDSRLDVIRVSLWASSPEEYAQNYPGTSPSTFFKVQDNLKSLAALKAELKKPAPSVVLHQPINRINFQNLEAFADMALATGCSNISLSLLRKMQEVEISSFCLSNEEESMVSLGLRRLKKKLQGMFPSYSIDPLLRRLEVGEAVWEKMPCYMGWITAEVKMDGTVIPCCSCNLPMGNINDSSMADIWNGQAYQTFRRQTITRRGLAAMSRRCDCAYCNYTDNDRVNRIFKWIAPFCWR